MADPIRCILFDLGNVLIKVNSGKFAEMMQSLTGLAPEQLRSGFADGSLVLEYECGRLSDEDFLAGLCSRLGVSITRGDFEAIWSSMLDESPLIPDPVLQSLSRNCLLWAVSNTNRMHFEYIRQNYKFLNYFRGWSLSYEVGAAKPDPAIYTHALDQCRVKASQALFIDDQPVNVDAARILGIDAIPFISPDQALEELRKRKLM